MTTPSPSKSLKDATLHLVAMALAAVIAIETAFLPKAQAAVTCEDLFLSTNVSEISRESLLDRLPPEFADAMRDFDPKVLAKLDDHYKYRDQVSAEKEASIIVARILRDDKSQSLRLRDVLTKKGRDETFLSLSHARLDHTSMDVRLENILLEIGYGEGSKTAQKWSNWRRRNIRGLEMIRRTAVNATANFLIGIPVELRRNQYVQFAPLKAQRRNWTETEMRLRADIEFRDPVLVKDFKREVLINFALRFMAVCIFVMLIDEFLERLYPPWRGFKIEFLGPQFVSRRVLETTAYNTWKNMWTAFGYEAPDDLSPLAQKFKAQIQATPLVELYDHVKNGTPLSDAPASAPKVPPSVLPGVKTEPGPSSQR